MAPSAVVSVVVLRPTAVTSAGAGAVQLSFRISRSSKVTFVLQRCTTSGCRALAHVTVGTPRGHSHISVLAVSGRRTLPDGHYRLVATPAGGRPFGVRLVVRG